MWPVWLTLGVIFSVLEIITPAFFFLWFGIGAFVTAILSLFMGIIWQLIAFAGISFILLLLTRPIVRKLTGDKQPRNIHVDEIVGKEAVVIEVIDNSLGKGLVKVDGDVWRAYSVDDKIIEKGEKVRITRVEGAHVVVERVKEG